ncbi:MAG: DUF1684 domain-containing protein [Xanthomonadales bacterium]|nr:DUF1684 domain-containing protein [Xanthomonadales bacterium]
MNTRLRISLAYIAACLVAAPGAPLSAADWRAELDGWRAQRAAGLAAPTGWLNLIGLHWLDGRPVVLGAIGADLVVEDLPPVLGTLSRDAAGEWTLALAEGVQAEVDGATVTGPVAMTSDRGASPERPQTRLRHGPVRMALIERGTRTGLRIWHADAAAKAGHAGLTWYPPDPDWRLEARWQAHPPGRTLDIATVIDTIEPMANPGALVFEHGGRSHRIETLREEGSEQLFLIFADRTSGRATYGAGRYLYTALPDDQGRVALDFNRAYNPPCAYTAFATCPLPPPENRLDLRIEAGERAYGKPE